jgi:hypothetical protein
MSLLSASIVSEGIVADMPGMWHMGEDVKMIPLLCPKAS